MCFIKKVLITLWQVLWFSFILHCDVYNLSQFDFKLLFTADLNWLPLWSRGQSSWLQIQRSGFDSLCHQIFWEEVGLEQGPLRLVSTIEELKVAIPVYKTENTAVGIHCADHMTPSFIFCWSMNVQNNDMTSCYSKTQPS
jgi:hypothetical protein